MTDPWSAQRGAVAPHFSLSLPNEPTISTVSSHVEPQFEIVDRRSELEKQYFSGNSDFQHWRDAVTILPMECLGSEFEALLKKRTLAILDSPVDCDRVTLEIHTFFIALDERESGRQKQQQNAEQGRLDSEQQLESRRERWWRERDCEDFGDYVASGILRAAVVAPAERRRLKQERIAREFVHPQTLPRQLTEIVSEGWNCVAKVVLILENNDTADNDRIPVDLHIILPAEPEKSTEDHVQAITLDAIAQLQHELRSALNAQRATVAN